MNKNLRKTGVPNEKVTELHKQIERGSFREAEQLASSLTKKYRAGPFVWKALAIIYLNQKKLDKAIKASKEAKKLDPKDAEIENNLGVCFQEKQNFAAAKVCFERAEKLRSGYHEAISNLGQVLIELKLFDQALAALDRALGLVSNDALTYERKAFSYHQLGYLDLARINYEKAISLNPGFSEAYNNLGVSLLALGEKESALLAYRKALELKPGSYRSAINIARTLKSLGYLQEAEKYCLSVLEKWPKNTEILFTLGTIQHDLDKFEAAIFNYKTVLKFQPDNLRAQHLLAAASGKTTNTAPSEYIESLFDTYAGEFDQHLVTELHYDVPRLIADLCKRQSLGIKIARILDIGCGTGLVGEQIRDSCDHLVGIDLSQGMLKRAKKKGLYDELIHYEAAQFLKTENLDFNYFIAADVFIYVGDLEDIFRSLKTRCPAGGRLLFSTEHSEAPGFFLETSGRYSHSKCYIEELCSKFHFHISSFTTKPLRKHNDRFISAGIYALLF